MRKVAILGSASSSISLAPTGDDSWEIWALAGARHSAERVTAFFEMHVRKAWRKGSAEFFESLQIPVYTLEAHDDLRQCVEYPMEEVFETIGRDYITSSIGYMLALAIHQHETVHKISEIGIWGVDLLHETEYAQQRPNTEWLIGLAQGLGIGVHIPEESAILKSNFLYGKSVTPIEEGPISQAFLESKYQELQTQKQRIINQLNQCTGAINQIECLIDYSAHYKRGGVIPGGKC